MTAQNRKTTKTMAWICTQCGCVYDSDKPPEVCPLCGASREKLNKAD